MCYLIAKDRDSHGCYALKTNHGRHLVELKMFFARPFCIKLQKLFVGRCSCIL